MDFADPNRSCLYLIDPQERLMAHIHGADQVVGNIRLMLHLARTLGFPVLANTQYREGIGPIVAPVAELLDGVPCPDKVEFNGLANPAVQEELDRLPPEVDTLLLCGVETHICVWQTGAAALSAGYRVQVVADAVSSRTRENHRYGLERLDRAGAVIAPAEMIVYEMLGRAATGAFKAMLPHLR